MARKELTDDKWKDRYAIRAGVEGTISQAVCVTGLRHTKSSPAMATETP